MNNLTAYNKDYGILLKTLQSKPSVAKPLGIPRHGTPNSGQSYSNLAEETILKIVIVIPGGNLNKARLESVSEEQRVRFL